MNNERIQRLHKFMHDFKKFLRDNYYDIENKDIQWYLRGLVQFNVNESSELIMENYEKLYKEALERAKILHKDAIMLQLEQDIKDYEYIFPELKESEDEKIRKDCMKYLDWQYQHCSINEDKTKIERCIAWLEKQGGQNSTDKVEPKFKIGDWVVTDYGKANQVVAIDDDCDGFTLDDYTYFSGSWKDNYHLWSIRDAKDGDVLQLGEVTAIFTEYIGNDFCICYCSFCKAGGFEIPIENGEDNSYGCYNATPATKEQRDLLFQKMHEAGYQWDAEKKEPKKIHVIDEGKSEMDYCFTKMIDGEKVSSAWSEEDERMSNAAIRACKYIVENFENSTKDCEDAIDWLKSLKDRVQSQWKPSDEQMRALHDLNLTGKISYAGQGQKLIDLYNDLRKLKE